MTKSEAQIDAEQTAATTALLKRGRLKPSVRARYDAAKASGDWATVAEIMGEDVGTN